jgi:hypothetical protein
LQHGERRTQLLTSFHCTEWPIEGKQREVVGVVIDSVEVSPTIVNQVQRNDTEKVWSNSFDVLRNKKVVEMEEGQIQSSRGAITAIQKIIEEALYEEHSRLKLKKVKGKKPEVEQDGHQGRGFSHTA